MATIALYADKVNQMPGLIRDVGKTVLNFKTELAAMKNKVLKINQGVCDMEDVASSIQASSQTQEEKVTSLETFQKDTEQFIEDTARIDNEAADIIRQRKDDFYEQYNYLRPESEKNWIENILDTAGQWCREHWKIIVTVVLVVVAVILICTGAGGPLAAIVFEMCKGLIIGSILGGALGGLSNVAAGKSFLEGFESGALSGSLMGAFFGSLFGAGKMLGSSARVLEFLGSVADVIPVVARISFGISMGMFSFDLLSLGISLFDRNNLLVQFNRELHSNTLYNVFQFTMCALAAFSGGYTKGRTEQRLLESGLDSIHSLDELLTNPDKLSGVSGKELYDYLIKNGYDVQPLSRGSYKGIPFEKGGGFKVNWGGDRILQYHPGDASHHGGAYFKISSGETGTIRIDLEGNIIE